MINATIIDQKDNVVLAIEKIKKDDEVEYKDLDGKTDKLTALNDIKIYHKIARVDIAKGDPIVKYGEHIGFALNNIKAGEHVHEHNVESRRENLQSIE